MGKDVFISYHGGYETDGKSSYEKALELKKFLETHSGKKFQCFLCKRENKDDFYDAIHDALIETKHLILVACNKEMLHKSEWIRDEVKQFDGLRKKGRKPNSVLNAFIFGDMTEDDLIDFNTVFTTKDIASGDDGFEALYKLLLEKESITSNASPVLDSEPLNKIISFKLHGEHLRQFLFEHMNSISDKKYLLTNIDNYLSYMDAANSKTIIQDNYEEGSLFLLNTLDALVVSKYLDSLNNSNINAIIFDKKHLYFYVIQKGKLVKEEQSEISVKVNEKIFKFSCTKANDSDLSEMYMNMLEDGKEKSILVQGYDSIEYNQISLNIYDNDIYNFSVKRSNVNCTDYYYFLLTSLLQNIITPEDDCYSKFQDEIDLMEFEISNDYNSEEFESQYITNEISKLIPNEKLLSDYYHDFKKTKQSNSALLSALSKTEYGDIARNLCSFYKNHSPKNLNSAITLMLELSDKHKKQEQYREYFYLICLLSEIYMHNVFVLGIEMILDKNIIEELEQISESCFSNQKKLHIDSLICTYVKEMFFCGHYKMIADTYLEAHLTLLNKFDRIIKDILSSEILTNNLNADLILLYRHRCVVWENCGDSTLHREERISYYQKWSEDCLKGIELCETYPADQEIFGCLYLNYASSLNRLTADISTNNIEQLRKCIECLDKALELLEGSSADRYLAYGYLHKSDCYEQMLLLNEQKEIDDPSFDYNQNVRLMGKFALMAWRYLTDTTDEIGKGWTLRLMSKSSMLKSEHTGSVKDLKRGLEYFESAIEACKKSNYVNGTASCIRDFSEYIRIIKNSNLTDELEQDVISAFLAETETFASIICLLKIDLQDVIEVQNKLEAIFNKLLI